VAAPKKTSAPKKSAAAETSSAPAKKRAVARAIPNPETSRPTLGSSHRKASSAAAKPAKAAAKPAKAAAKPAKVAKVAAKAAAKPAAEKAPKKSAAKASAASELPLPARVRKAKTETAIDAAADLGKVIALAALDKKALHVEVIDVRGRLDYADVVVLSSGRSDRQAVAIAQAMEDEAKRKLSRRTISVEGVQTGQWILLDFGDVVAHVFTEDARNMYDLDGLFTEADKIPVE